MNRTIAFSLGILVVVLALGSIGYYFFLAGPTGAGTVITQAEYERLDAIRRAANRDLENQSQLDIGASESLPPQQVAADQVKKLGEMAAPYGELAKDLPNEAIGPRNAAVVWMLAQMPNGVDRQNLSEEEAANLDDSASLAIAKLMETQEKESASHMLAALFAMRRMERFRRNVEAVKTLREEAIRELKMALDANAANYEAAYQLGVLLDSDRNVAPPEEAVEAFAIAAKARPGNFYILMRRLNALVRTKNPTTAEACREAKAQCECVRRRILRENDPESDLIVLLDRAAKAAEEMKWDEAAEALQTFDSWLTVTAADLGDLPEVTPHPLDYMVFDFSPQLRDKHALAIAEEPVNAITFELKKQTDPQLASPPIQVRLIDFDLDGKLEMAVLESTQLQIFAQGDNGDWQIRYTLPLVGARGMVWGDLDRDEDRQIKNDYVADLDLLLYSEKGLTIYLNERDAASGERTLKASGTPRTEAMENAVLVDFDHDGDLDIVAFAEGQFALLSNLGNATFEDVSAYSSLPKLAAGAVKKMVAVDFDRDGDLDVMVTCFGQKRPGFLDNVRHGQMRWRELPDDFRDLTGAYGLYVAELDGNGAWDLIIYTREGFSALMTEQTGEGEIRLKQRQAVPLMLGRVNGVGDFDNDGRTDVLVYSAQGGFFWRGDGMGGFGVNNSSMVFEYNVYSPQLQIDVDDLDDDGDLDVAFADRVLGRVTNEGGNQNNWVSIRPRGAEDNVSGKVNHGALGTLVEVRSGARYQAAVTDRPSVHFGLGAAKSADQIRLIFTNGFPQSVLQSRLAGNQVIVEDMALKGSCPYVYTDRGNGWEFFSDCLWGAPIGMQYAEAKLQPGRAWEYLKLPGELLKEKDGAYRIKFTEELWEATYVDHVSLIAVDHPENVDVFTNEKVGPPSIAENRLFTVSERKLPLSTKDLKGRDIAKELAKADGAFTQGWEVSYKQGLVEKHGLELDLGAFEPNASVVLYLTGWIMPTDTSLNVAITQDPRLEGPRPPSLSVFDEQGKLQEVAPMIGFPGGKTKTMAVDLTGKFLSNDHRVVISTTHQIYWDEAFFTVNEPAVELETQVMPLLSAKMVYHGFSKKSPALPRSPSVFDASQIDVAPRWMPMVGGFTPFGEAISLLAETDDQMAIIGSGDGIELSFKATPPPKAGWRRDFILHSVGWDKDADLNTFFGQTVGPMPVGADGGYLGPAVLQSTAQEGSRIQPRSRFWKALVQPSK